MVNLQFGKEILLVIAGAAGQGVDTITQVIAETIKQSGYNIFYTKEYMSRIKGGCNSSTIRIAKNKVDAHKEIADFIFAISKEDLNHVENRTSDNTIVFSEYDIQPPLDKFKNAIISGIIIGLLDIDLALLQENFKKTFSDKDNDIIEKNLEAATKGNEIGKNLLKEKNISIDIQKDSTVKGEILINGNDAAALGCIAGGCDFISAYPMSPSTGILTFMAKHSKEFNIFVEQAEDEIAAINMGLGAWYAGARAMTSTSGGGFALMTEAVSLAGMIESPMVIYIGQRPGPATGLPTRTEQGDLNLALYSGHGEFPRIILTPGNLQECFELGKKAFDLADKFQVPVFILSDQYLVDSCYNTEIFDIEHTEIPEYIEKTNENYQRYSLVPSGISFRGIPNYGDGFVVVDSDEHDEDGHITENLDLRIQMVEKRMSKFKTIRRESIQPEYFGKANAEFLIIGWGSTCNIIKETLKKLNNQNIAFLHFKQVYPLNKDILLYFKNTKGLKKVICIENNYSGQFANLLKQELDIKIDKKILKYNGLPFSVEELIEKINEVII